MKKPQFDTAKAGGKYETPESAIFDFAPENTLCAISNKAVTVDESWGYDENMEG